MALGGTPEAFFPTVIFLMGHSRPLFKFWLFFAIGRLINLKHLLLMVGFKLRKSGVGSYQQRHIHCP